MCMALFSRKRHLFERAKLTTTFCTTGTVTEIKKSLSETTGLGIEQMGICDIYSHKIFKVLNETHMVKHIRDNDDIVW